MGCCGSGGGSPRRYELTTADGQRRVFLTETEARVAMATSGQDGRIRVLR